MSKGIKLKKFKLYYRKPKRDGDQVTTERTLFNAEKRVLLYSTCLSVLSRLHEESYKLKAILYIDDTLYLQIKKEINLIDQKEDKDYITLYTIDGQTVFRLRSNKHEVEDMELIKKQEEERMQQKL